MERGDAWYSNFPDPRSQPRSMTDEQVATLVKDPEKRGGRDYIIVDVRRTDFEVADLPAIPIGVEG
jgi:arsenical-resistance protein 2